MIGPGAADASGAYALAWGLVFHLVEKHPHKLAAFLRDPAPPAGAPLPAFENAFGPLDAAFHSTWRTHMLTLDPSHSPMPPSARP
jgi:hypothetical protein